MGIENFKQFGENLLSLSSPIFTDFDIEKAYAFCKKVALEHYENFPVGSWLVPKDSRRFFYSIYAFARLADDLADEVELNFSSDERIQYLNKLGECLSILQDSEYINNPIFLALKDTIERKELPLLPFQKLLEAFKMDVNFVQPNDFEDLERYCSYSANPIGELVLRLFNEYNEKSAKFSDMICTGLQLANFWQDLSRDLPIGRVYIPKVVLDNVKLSTEDLLLMRKRENIEICLKELIEKTRWYFLNGWQILIYISDSRLKFELNAIIFAGLRILKKESKLGIKILQKRPKLNGIDFARIFFKALI